MIGVIRGDVLNLLTSVKSDISFDDVGEEDKYSLSITPPVTATSLNKRSIQSLLMFSRLLSITPCVLLV